MVHPAIQFYLASASPRRSELLSGVGLRFEVVAADIDESVRGAETPLTFASRVALAKARRGAAMTRGKPRLPVLAADTCVTIDGEIFGKPSGGPEAVAMLRRLSGRTHEVITALALLDGDHVVQNASRTRVTFKRLSASEIDRYWLCGEPMGKAGAYAIQGRGSAFVKRVEGSYTGVVGMPMYESRCLLIQAGIDWL